MTSDQRNPRPDEQQRDEPPAAEIAALTARLRELSTPGRVDDPAARAAFLADKDALFARISDPYLNHGEHDQDGGGGRESGARGEDNAGRVLHVHRALTNPDGRAASSTAGYPGWAADVPMPGWMREQAAATEAAMAVGSAPPAGRDEPAEVAARIAALHDHIAAAVSCALGDAERQEERREQLTRWHDDDPRPDATADATDDAAGGDWPDGGAGEGVFVRDDGPGLP